MKTYHLFEVIGVELEYMIVDSTTLKAKPIADSLIFELTGEFTSDVVRGEIAWSNELVSHVIELKTNGPTPKIENLHRLFHEEVLFINSVLAKHGAVLMPTGAHPFFNPEETVIWPHEYNEVYSLYDRIFGCKGHGWSNLQSTHLNLPFANDEEFEKLHAAIRILLPIIPAIAASTPIIESLQTGFIDTRLEYYRKNQSRIPEIAGLVIPEEAFSKAEYEHLIFNPIAKAIAPFDEEHVLDKHFLNSRGAIARFDRGAIEIRVIDIQECPAADLAIVDLIIQSIKWLIANNDLSLLKSSLSTIELSELFLTSIKMGSLSEVKNTDYLALFSSQEKMTMMDIWKNLFANVKASLSKDSISPINHILKNGNLSERILSSLENGSDPKQIKEVYQRLIQSLSKNEMFDA